MNLTSTYARIIVRTPKQAASLVAGGCGCDELERPETFAVANPDAPVGTVTWSGPIVFEDQLTGDGRYIDPNALRWDTLPIPLRYAPVDTGGHDGAQVVGRILTIERRDGGVIWATGDFDMRSEIGREAARVVGDKVTNGISVDLDSVSFEIRVKKELLQEINEDLAEDPPQVEPVESGEDEEGRVTVIAMENDDEVFATTDARVRAATIVAIPAFEGARIDLDEQVPDEVDGDNEPEIESESLAAGAAPLNPPAAWFQDPQLTGPTPLTITEDGRVFGHLAVWGTCHTAYTGRCVEPPHSPSGYAYFRTGALLTAEGTEVPVGTITLDTLHAGRGLGPADTLAHYEHTGKGAVDVSAGEDVYGIWVAGALRPGLPDEKIRVLRASPISGDWRRIGGSLELVAALAVNSPGFPVPRPQGLVAGGAMVSLVASGMMAPAEQADSLQLSAEDVLYLKQLADQMRQQDTAEQDDLRQQAEEMAASVRQSQAAALARTVR